jgi:SOS-response transcriptional repressor LexA
MPPPAVFPVLPAKEVLPSRPYGLTRTQHDMMLVIQELTMLGGQPPTLDEISTELCMTGRASVHKQLSALRARGYLDWLPCLRRSITVRVPLPVPVELSGERPDLEILRLPSEPALAAE